MREALASISTATLLRWGLLALASVSLIGLALELVFLKHWGDTQTIVWLGMFTLTIALVLLVIRPNRTRVRIAQGLALAAGLVAVIGIGFHLDENLHAGPLDRDYAETWDTMSSTEQLWAAATGEVGPAPTLAPGALAQISLVLLLATVRHPTLEPPQGRGAAVAEVPPRSTDPERG